jgi:hypothetical protein
MANPDTGSHRIPRMMVLTVASDTPAASAISGTVCPVDRRTSLTRSSRCRRMSSKAAAAARTRAEAARRSSRVGTPTA